MQERYNSFKCQIVKCILDFIAISHLFLRFDTLTVATGGAVAIFDMAGVATGAVIGVVLAAVMFAAGVLGFAVVTDADGLGFAVVTAVGADVTLASFL